MQVILNHVCQVHCVWPVVVAVILTDSPECGYGRLSLENPHGVPGRRIVVAEFTEDRSQHVQQAHASPFLVFVFIALVHSFPFDWKSRLSSIFPHDVFESTESGFHESWNIFRYIPMIRTRSTSG